MRRRITLTNEERAALLQQDPNTADDGGFQQLLVKLQEQLDQDTNELRLDNGDLERIPRYAFDYGNGGWEDRLKRIFSRSLGFRLGRNAPAK